MVGQVFWVTLRPGPKAVSSQVVFKPTGKMYWVTLVFSPHISESFHFGRFLGLQILGSKSLWWLWTPSPFDVSAVSWIPITLFYRLWTAPYLPLSDTVSPLHMNLQMANFQRRERVFYVHWHTCASSTCGYAFVFSIVQNCIEYTSTVSLF